MLDVAADVAAEKSIEQLVEARSPAQEEANHIEMAWKESTRRFNRTRHREYAQGWHDHHERQLAALEATFAVLTARPRAERDRYAAMLGIPVSEAQPMDGADGPPPEAA